MSITGIIRPEYRQPLLELRERLGVTSQQARELYLNAVSKRMIPMIEWIVSEMERTVFSQQQLSQRRQKDLGEDYFRSGKEADGTLGLGAEINVLGDVLNLVDFYMANDIAEQHWATPDYEHKADRVRGQRNGRCGYKQSANKD